MATVNDRTADGVPLSIGMGLWHVRGGPPARLVEVVDGGLCLTVEGVGANRGKRSNWWASSAYSTMEAADAAREDNPAT